jgi:hypothetical protein
MKSAAAINGNAKLNRPLPNPKMSSRKKKKVKIIKAQPVIYDLPISQKFLIASSYLLAELFAERFVEPETGVKGMTMDESIAFIQARLTRQDLISEVEINSVLEEMLTSNRGIVLRNADLFDEF